jgi:hypothetical protein
MDDEFLLPSDRLEVGDEMARGSFGAVYRARLYGMAVCAKVRHSAAAPAFAADGAATRARAPLPVRFVAVFGLWLMAVCGLRVALASCLRRRASCEGSKFGDGAPFTVLLQARALAAATCGLHVTPSCRCRRVVGCRRAHGLRVMVAFGAVGAVVTESVPHADRL